MFDPFSHYLAFGSTDQQTLRSLRGSYDGLLVPGTIAAFQKQGTGGFVLTLSAAEAAVPYVIDSRFPLFQQPLSKPKKSHEALATAFGDRALITSSQPDPSDFPEDRLRELARSWLEFNASYRSAASEKFDKYARRLGEPVAEGSAQAPLFVAAPYFVSHKPGDVWWTLSKRLFDLSVEAGQQYDMDVVRVVCVVSPRLLDGCLSDIPDERSLIWVSNLHELDSSEADLSSYGRAIMNASHRGQSVGALYGGFFAVLLGAVGLSGTSHGIGFGEHRDWVELPQSGPPPARFYLPAVHRYVQQDLAQRAYQINPDLIGCECSICGGRPPVVLDYHELMQHSVLCRTAEIETWAGLGAQEALERLETEYSQARSDFLQVVGDGTWVGPSAAYFVGHLGLWLQAFSDIIGAR